MTRGWFVVVLALAACGSDDPPAGNGTSGGASSSSDVVAGGDGSAADLCVQTINDYRKTQNLPALTRWTDAESCADGQAKSDGETKKAHGAFPKCGEFAQNECPGWPGPASKMIPDCLKAMWNEGPGGGHHDAMASAKYTKVSCGFATVSGGAVWAVQDFR